MRKALDLRKDKIISNKFFFFFFFELAECVSKNNIFEHYILFGRKMAAAYAILFLGDLEVKHFSVCDILPLVWWRYIDESFTL